jgi:hypothetical protein
MSAFAHAVPHLRRATEQGEGREDDPPSGTAEHQAMKKPNLCAGFPPPYDVTPYRLSWVHCEVFVNEAELFAEAL